MTKEEILVRNIVGPFRGEITTYACAIEVLARLLFTEHVAQDDILVTKHVYPEVAKRTSKSYRAVARNIERMGNLCWDSLSEEGRQLYIGRRLTDIRAPRDMLFYLAFYSHFGKPYYEILEEQPELLFQEGQKEKEEDRVE